MFLKPNPPQSALVLSPHPDDESLACGGTLKLLTLAGGHVDVLYMTSGENGFFPNARPSEAARNELKARRQAEAREACRLLGVSKVAFLDGRDGRLCEQPDLAAPIRAALAAHNYRSVFCPWPQDGHPDHAATFSMLNRALSDHAGDVDVWLYEVWAPVAANMFICIDATIDAKIQAFEAHQSQASVLNYADAFRGLARYRSLFCPPARYAEAFYNCDSSALVRNQGLPWSSGVQSPVRIGATS
jgi:LmbE family N-acetylglucosaminyl deacetylase